MNTPYAPNTRPQLRNLDGNVIQYEGMNYFHLRDPLSISGKTLLVPEPFIPMLSLLDGTRDTLGLKAAMMLHFGVNISLDQINRFISALDDARYLENTSYQLDRQSLLDELRESGVRPAVNAGVAYPETEESLRLAFEGYIQELTPEPKDEISKQEKIRGIISPHIDYQRGSAVYARLWSHVSKADQDVEQVILLGTDHFSEGIPFSLTSLDYVSPFGRLPTQTNLVNGFAHICGKDSVFAGELHHRTEHSIELAAIWLQYVLQGREVPILPVLCGPLTTFENDSGDLTQSQTLNDLVAFLKQTASERPTWVIAAGDLSHVGPAFGGSGLNAKEIGELARNDQTVIDFILRGDPEGFYRHIHLTEDRTNICGTSPIYLALRILGRTAGINHAYLACPADTQKTSFVTICGITLL